MNAGEITAERVVEAIRRHIDELDRSRTDTPNGDTQSDRTVIEVTDQSNRPATSVGSRIRAARGSRSQRTLAVALGLSPMTLIRYERGEREPDATVLAGICHLCGVTADWLLFGRGDGPVVAAPKAAAGGEG